MHTSEELEAKLWHAIKHDRTLMLGLDGIEDGHSRPMTAQFEQERGPLWFFTSSENAMVQKLGAGGSERAIAAFASKDHELFASLQGALRVDTDHAVVERLWSPFVSAWFDGKDDPKLRLLRLDPEHAEIWQNANSLIAGVKLLFGVDPKRDYKDNVAQVDLH
jgi:general stress protein 26